MFKTGDRVKHWEGAFHGYTAGTIDGHYENRYYRVIYGPYPFVDGRSSWNTIHESNLELVTVLDLLAEI